ncbi:cob(I)yrinic acid a,c-diamide adenosyltransferase [Lentisphaerota bacterium WC36G]|nr:cob(I)yrinic acid a,c-diamide adenosyltransferase [Lentisphaerae bacterium WC36]
MANSGQGIIVVNTGNGKGKTTAALGMVLRSLGYENKVAVVQFAKGNWLTGERNFAELLLEHPKLQDKLIWQCGAVKSGKWLKDNDEIDNFQLGKVLFDDTKKIVSENSDLQLLVLDEFNIALANKYIDLVEFLDFISQCKKANIDVVITGRNAPKELIDAADTVSDINEIKHAFKAGIIAKKGVDF